MSRTTREVPDAVLLFAEDRSDEDPGRIVDATDEGEPGPAPFEPVVPAAIDLDERAGLGHPLAPAAVPRRPTSARRGDARVAQEAPQRRPADGDLFLLGERLREVGVVVSAVHGPGELEDPRPVVVG